MLGITFQLCFTRALRREIVHRAETQAVPHRIEVVFVRYGQLWHCRVRREPQACVGSRCAHDALFVLEGSLLEPGAQLACCKLDEIACCLRGKAATSTQAAKGLEQSQGWGHHGRESHPPQSGS